MVTDVPEGAVPHTGTIALRCTITPSENRQDTVNGTSGPDCSPLETPRAIRANKENTFIGCSIGRAVFLLFRGPEE